MTQTEERLLDILKDFQEGIYLGVNDKKEGNCSITYIFNNGTNMDHVKQKMATIIANNIETYDMFSNIMFLAAMKMKLKMNSN